MASVAAALVLFSLRNGVQQTVFQGANQTDLKSITVYPQGGGFLKLVKDTAGVPITDATIGEIEQIPGVAMIHRQLLYRGLASLELNILGQTFQTDTLIFGADEGMVNNSGATYKNWGVPVEQYSQPRDVPVVASKKLLDFYNLSLATSGDLPGLSEGMLTGTPISILPGFSSLLATAGTEKPAPVQGQIIAFENNAELLGITVPIDYVFALNKKEGITSPQYSKLRLVLESPDEMESVALALADMKLKVLTPRSDAQTGPSLTSLDITLFSLTIIIALLCGLLIASNVWTLFIKRWKEYGIYRCLGASRTQLGSIIVRQLIFLATLGSVLGLLIGSSVIWTIRSILKNSLQLVSFPIENILLPTAPLYPILFVVGIAFCLICCALPIRKLLNLDPKTATL